MEQIREKLFEKQDLKYKEFHSSLCPNVDKIIGVRVPELRKMAKEISTQNYDEFLTNAQNEYYEELLLQGLVIGYAKISIEETFEYLKNFVPKINSWAVCDTTCSNLKITKKHMQEIITKGTEIMVKYNLTTFIFTIISVPLVNFFNLVQLL